MNIQKIILSILGVALVLGLGFVAVKSNDRISDQGNEKPAETPEVPVEIPTKPAENPAIKAAQFNQIVTLHLNTKTSFSDGLNVTLKEINDSTCPKDVQCFWAGELSVVLLLSSGKLGTVSEEINLGVNKSVVLKGYTFSLMDATANSATIIVK